MAQDPIQLPAQGAHDRLSPAEKWRRRKYDHSPHLVSILRKISPILHMRSWLIQGQFHLQFHLLIYRYNDLFIHLFMLGIVLIF